MRVKCRPDALKRLASPIVFVAVLNACTTKPQPSSTQNQPGLNGTPTTQAPQASPVPTKPPVAIKELTGRLNVTFLVASDTHIGYRAPEDPLRDPLSHPHGIEKTNLRMIAAMNAIEGRAFPPQIGGKVHTPRGVLISGDLTEHGGQQEWEMWTRFYGLTGKEGPLKIPVFEGAGNHDRVKNWHIREQVAKRHGGRHYFFDWEDLRIVCLGEAADDSALEVLQQAFDTAAPDVPFVLYFHYPLLGPFSDNWWTKEDGPQKLHKAIEGRRILAIFHGHYHATGAYKWQGYDVYNVGSPKHTHHSFAVVQVDNEDFRVAEWNYDTSTYSWWHRKPTNPERSAERAPKQGYNHNMKPKPSFKL